MSAAEQRERFVRLGVAAIVDAFVEVVREDRREPSERALTGLRADLGAHFRKIAAAIPDVAIADLVHASDAQVRADVLATHDVRRAVAKMRPS